MLDVSCHNERIGQASDLEILILSVNVHNRFVFFLTREGRT